MAFDRLVLHVGAHKTGTSLIQKFMTARPELMREHAIGFYPRNTAQHVLGWHRTDRPSERVEEVLNAIRTGRPHDTYILSHENLIGKPFLPNEPTLYPRAGQAGPAFVDALSYPDVRVLFYIRKQSSWVQSYYLQTVHQGGTQRFREWLAAIDLAAISWADPIRRLHDNFADKLTVLDFDEEIARGQAGFLRSFFEHAGVKSLVDAPEAVLEYYTPHNMSIGDLGLDLALAMNPFLTLRRQRTKVRRFLQTHFSNRDYPRPALLTAEERAALDARYNEENAELLARYGAKRGMVAG